MKIRIIKHKDREKTDPKIHVAADHRPGKTELGTTAATIQYWIDDLRRKRERERVSIKECFSEGSLLS